MKFLKIIPSGKAEWRNFALRWILLLLIIIPCLFYITKTPGISYLGQLPPLTENEKILRRNIETHVVELADKIGQRNIDFYFHLQKSETYIIDILKKIGYNVTTQEFKVRQKIVKNIEVELTGISLPKEIVLIGAHYDSVLGSKGANDNASGVAALLELARILKDKNLSRTIRFVAFVNEEPPYFRTEHMGSVVYASHARMKGDNIVAMYSLETIGYYSNVSGSQEYPFPFSLFYPDTGNFIAFVGNLGSRDLLHKSLSIFRRKTSFPSEGVSAPGWMTGIGWSDQWSFWKEDYPGIMITDTALFRYKLYHTMSDTFDKLDYSKMSRIVSGIARMLEEIAD